MSSKSLLLTSLLLICFFLNSCKEEKNTDYSLNYVIENGVIKLDEPKREVGQKSALLLTVPAMDTVRVGFIGVGMRGSSAVKRFTYIDGVKIVAICDLLPERVESANEILAKRGLAKVDGYSSEEGWKELCQRDDIDLVYICTPWENHVPMAIYAMEQGKNVAVEVPAAMTIKDCWALINTSEKTRKHCMMLENCVYDFYETTVLNMAQKGLFGEIVHTQGGYIHNLDPYWKEYQGNWRLAYNTKHRGDIYPTHGIGPICQVLNIHRGDKMNYLVSVDSNPFHGKDVAKEQMGVEDYANGDHTVTLIRTEQGRIIEIQHNVCARRPYDRLFQITGTKGFATKYPFQNFALMSEKLSDDNKAYDNLDGESFLSEQAKADIMKEYTFPIINEIKDKAKKVGGHGGMDYIMDYRLIYCLRNGLPLDMDVYDAAEWSCLTELSRISIENNSMPVIVPDFTRGDWDKVQNFKFLAR